MKTIVVFCATGKKPSTIQAVKKLYPGEDTHIIWTTTAKNAIRNWTYGSMLNLNVNNKNVTVPIATSNSPNAFNTSLSRILGNKKVDLFVFEYCSGLPHVNSAAANRISNILKKYSKNNSRVITHVRNRRNWSTRLQYNKTINVNESVNKEYHRTRNRIARKRAIASRQANKAYRAAHPNLKNNSNSNSNNSIANVSNNNNNGLNRTRKVNVFKFLK